MYNVCAGWSEPLWSHMPHCWKSHVLAHILIKKVNNSVNNTVKNMSKK